MAKSLTLKLILFKSNSFWRICVCFLDPATPSASELDLWFSPVWTVSVLDNLKYSGLLTRLELSVLVAAAAGWG